MYSTSTRSADPARTGRAGTTVSFSSCVRKPAGRPSTRTVCTSRPSASSSRLGSAVRARAVIAMVASTVLVAGR